MANIKLFIALLLLVTVGYGCSDVAFDGDTTEAQTEVFNIRTPGEAAEIALRALGRDGRKGAQYSLQCYTSLMPGRSGSDTTAYIVNFSNPEGFVIVPSDRALPDVVAYSDENNFDLDCESGQILQATFLDMLPAWAQWERDTTLNPGRPVEPGIPTTNRLNEVKPIERLKHWSQEAPYNKYCPIKTETREGANGGTDTVTGNCVVGCVALALGQVMLECKESLVIQGLNIPSTNDVVYTVFNDTANATNEERLDVLAQFLYLLGRYEVGTWYGLTSSSAYHGVCPRILSKYGYSTVNPDFVSYNAQDIVQDLNDGYLVLMRTDAYEKETNEERDGHIWVVDGCYQKMWMGADERLTMLHFEMGFGGRNNGYYAGTTYEIHGWIDYIFGKIDNVYLSVKIEKDRQ